MKLFSFILLVILLSGKTFAAHTWHNVTSISGTWNTTLRLINEADKGWFVAADDKTQIEQLIISQGNPQKFGFVFKPGATFDIAYTVTITKQQSEQNSQFVAPTCVYVVTAKGPGKPDVSAIPYNHAQCTWIDTGRGEDFIVSFGSPPSRISSGNFLPTS